MKTRETYHHGNLRGALIEEACHRLRQDGAEGVSLRELAQAVGVSPNAPYRHFTDKEALLAAVAAQGFVELTKRFDGVSARKPERKLAGLGEAYVRFAVEERALFRVMFSPRRGGYEAYPELAQAAGEAFERLVDAVEAPTLRETMRRATLSWATFHGYASLVVDGALSAEDGALRPTELGPLLHGCFTRA